MAAGPGAWLPECPIGSAAPQLLCTPGARPVACPTQPRGAKEGQSLSRLFSYLCSSPAAPTSRSSTAAIPPPTLPHVSGPLVHRAGER